MDWYLHVLRNYAKFDGRAHRTEYWMFVLFNFVFGLVAALIDRLFDIQFFNPLYGLAVLIPSLAVLFRRLHDTGRSGWWWLIGFVPVIGWIVLLVFTLQRGEEGANRYGLPPGDQPEWRDAHGT